MNDSITELISLNSKLTELLSDPQPGISSWTLFVARTIQRMAIIVGEDYESGLLSGYSKGFEAGRKDEEQYNRQTRHHRPGDGMMGG